MATISPKRTADRAAMTDIIATLRLTDDCEFSLITPNGSEVRMSAVEWNSLLDAAGATFVRQQVPKAEPAPQAPLPAPPPRKCIVNGCTSMSHKGTFVGDLCGPCHNMLSSGAVGNGATFIHRLRDKLTKVADIVAF